MENQFHVCVKSNPFVALLDTQGIWECKVNSAEMRIELTHTIGIFMWPFFI